MTFKDYLNSNIVCFDGGMGTLLQARGLKAGEYPERWNLTRPEVITEVHKAYYDAGSNVVCTNTFGANTLKFSKAELEEIIAAAVANAKQAKRLSSAETEKFIALDIGPTGKLLKPLGELEFEDAVEVFSQTVKFGVKYGVDLVLIETMNDSYETKAALLAAKECCDLPVIVSNAYGENGKLMTGASPAAMVALIEGMGADALGANCSLGPKQLHSVVHELLEYATKPVIVKPNAGLPSAVNGKTVFDVMPDEFAEELALMLDEGVRIVGGCCGTTPEYIKSVGEKLKDRLPRSLQKKDRTLVSSYTAAVEFDSVPVLIGERINPTGKKRFKQALVENDIGYILTEAVKQQECGVQLLDVNVGLPEIDEAATLKSIVAELQTVTDLPLQIDSSDPLAMEAALRCYNGKAMINSVNGKAESMKAVFPLVKKYGGVVVALTLDENGIPQTARERVDIARHILKTAEEYGIDKKDIVFDPLAMTISADANAARTALHSIKLIGDELNAHTVLGVSNVSYGLPCRSAVNGTFLVLAFENGLSAAIVNPFSADIMKAYYSYNALKGLDKSCEKYINATRLFAELENDTSAPLQSAQATDGTELQHAIVKGMKDKAAKLTRESLKTIPPLTLVNDEIIPALNTVGKGYENKTVYLPQLLMSAEAAKLAFEVVKSNMDKAQSGESAGTVVIATVEGDIHDIGKNIVKLLLENYGFDVIDLGKDVPAEKIADAVIKTKARLVGLSALMTTTVPFMEQAIKLLHEKAPWCKIVVGGAVLTKEYADMLGADKYAADAMETVRFAESVLK